MRLVEFMLVIVAALMFLIPNMKKEAPTFEREAQEEEAIPQTLEEPHTYKVTYESRSPEDDAVADIMWMKKAAEVARDAGIPYFNVVKQKTARKLNKKFRKNLTTIDGVIQLDNDPMRAEYDAQEIDGLVLTETPEKTIQGICAPVLIET